MMTGLPDPAASVRPHTPDSLEQVTADVTSCRACPRLVAWREQVARKKRAAFAEQDYWGLPVPGFGDPSARLLVVGLAPAAHGGNRTGRVFTGDRAGDWLFRALWKGGWANQPTSVAIDDGLSLTGAWVTAAVRCAPPANKPTTQERDTCVGYLAREMALLGEVRVILALGAFAYHVSARMAGIRPLPRFGHGVEVPLAPERPRAGQAAAPPAGPAGTGQARTLICSFHPSQQNTFTGKLTEAAFDAVFARAHELIVG